MVTVRVGDVIHYRPGCILEPLTGVVERRVSRRTLALFDGSWIPACSVTDIIRHARPMPTPNAIAGSALAGQICLGPGRNGRPRACKPEPKPCR